MSLGKRAQKFQELLDGRNPGLTVKELSDSTRSAEEAAAALGCEQAQIVKSLVFRNAETNTPVVVLASGTNRVDEDAVATATAIQLDKADAGFVKSRTGFSIGGVPPLGHKEETTVIVDQDLLQYDEVWAAAGTPNAVFCIRGPITAILASYQVITVG